MRRGCWSAYTDTESMCRLNDNPRFPVTAGWGPQPEVKGPHPKGMVSVWRGGVTATVERGIGMPWGGWVLPEPDRFDRTELVASQCSRL